MLNSELSVETNIIAVEYYFAAELMKRNTSTKLQQEYHLFKD